MTELGQQDHDGDVGDRAFVPRPRWVRVLLVVAGLVAVLLVALALAGGDHGPGRHLGGAPQPSAGPT